VQGNASKNHQLKKFIGYRHTPSRNINFNKLINAIGIYSSEYIYL